MTEKPFKILFSTWLLASTGLIALELISFYLQQIGYGGYGTASSYHSIIQPGFLRNGIYLLLVSQMTLIIIIEFVFKQDEEA